MPTISKHAAARLRERGIGLGEVNKAIRRGHVLPEWSRDPRCVVVAYGTLRVVINMDQDRVVTAYRPPAREGRAGGRAAG